MTYDNIPSEEVWHEFRVGQGILVDGSRILLAANRWYSNRPPVWTLPGGRAEEGEGVAEATVREMKEETGLSVAIESLAFVAEARSTRSLRLFHTCGFVVRKISGELSCGSDSGVEELRFVPISDLGSYLLSPSILQPVEWYLDNRSQAARYWFFPEYQAD